MEENEHRSRAAPAVKGAEAPPLVLHASAVAFGAAGVLILGPSGAGKSGLALRLMAAGARLVADDRVVLVARGDGVTAEAPAALAGLVEARGVGLMRLAGGGPAALALAVDLGRAPEARMPQRRKIVLLDHEIPLIYGRVVPNVDAIITVLCQGRGVLL